MSARLLSLPTRRIGIRLGLALLAATLPARAIESDPGLLETQVKAAYLYKFTSYVQWPDTALPGGNGGLVIGVMDADDLAGELDHILRDRHVASGQRGVMLKRLKLGMPLSGVQVLFVGRQDADRLKQALAAAQAQPVLTVTESPGGLDAGSMINFVVEDSHVRFEIARGTAERNNLRLSARLLAVARQVRNEVAQ